MRQVCGTATKKPVTINWFLWRGHSEAHMKELESWINSFGEIVSEVIHEKDGQIRVMTLEGISYEVPHTYVIIRGIKGEYYPCEYNIFKQTYDVEEVKLVK